MSQLIYKADTKRLTDVLAIVKSITLLWESSPYCFSERVKLLSRESRETNLNTVCVLLVLNSNILFYVSTQNTNGLNQLSVPVTNLIPLIWCCNVCFTCSNSSFEAFVALWESSFSLHFCCSSPINNISLCNCNTWIRVACYWH